MRPVADQGDRSVLAGDADFGGLSGLGRGEPVEVGE
jgi:hypothetical protein